MRIVRYVRYANAYGDRELRVLNIQWVLLVTVRKFICLFVCFIRALRRFQQSFSHIATVSGCGKELNALF